jgi:hypothetical protein
MHLHIGRNAPALVWERLSPQTKLSKRGDMSDSLQHRVHEAGVPKIEEAGAYRPWALPSLDNELLFVQLIRWFVAFGLGIHLISIGSDLPFLQAHRPCS